jgi:2-dehydro-3-deoxy-D-gluconate 5-dehydrogenase
MSQHLFSLNGKVAAITGATRGIGRSMALALAEAGADIALLQDKAQLNEAIPQVISELGTIDILVNNGGIQRRSPAVDFSEADWDDVIQVNLKAVWILCQQAGRHMVEKGSGKIINMASLLSYQGGITVPTYASSKGAVAQLTKALSNEWAKHCVNVNAIVPGYIATDMNTALINDEIRSKQILDRIPAERWGDPADFNGAVVYLASDASNYVHGHLLAIDGGWLGR